MEECPRRLSSLVLSALAWVGFVVVMLWTMGFLAGVVVPRTVDGPARTTTGLAVAADLGLLGLFAVAALRDGAPRGQVMAASTGPGVPRAHDVRPGHRHLPRRAAGAVAALGRPGLGRERPGSGRPVVLCAAGWLLAVAATFAVDHLELTGLRQAGWAARRSSTPVTELQTGGLYAVVRHPLLTGMVLAFWATPQMSASHLLFALAATAYVAVGMRFEERDLRRSFGASYDVYAAHVPALVPRLPRVYSVAR